MQIFHTGQGPSAGTEDKFPGPDNPSKMRRSVENAEHVGKQYRSCYSFIANLHRCLAGLFAPRAGQNFRDEQRRRRSQYDRGTRLAEIEDAWDFNLGHHDLKSNTNCLYPLNHYGRLRGCTHASQDHY